MQTLKNTVLSIAFLVVAYFVFGGYIVAMFNGLLPMQYPYKPVRTCAIFQDGTQYASDHWRAIDRYHEKTGQSFEYLACKSIYSDEGK